MQAVQFRLRTICDTMGLSDLPDAALAAIVDALPRHTRLALRRTSARLLRAVDARWRRVQISSSEHNPSEAKSLPLDVIPSVTARFPAAAAIRITPLDTAGCVCPAPFPW